jgi:hypothetical protein
MYRLVVVMGVSALLLAMVPFVQYARGLGLLSPWVLAAMGAAMLLSLGAVLVALGLALWAGNWPWIWGLGLLLPLGLFGWLWLAVASGSLAGATLVFLPPVVAGAFGWQGVIQRRRTALRRPAP